MVKDRFSSQTRELLRLLFVLASSLVAAAFVTYFFVHYYSPSGRYKVEAVVLEPHTLRSLDIPEEGKQGKKERYYFDRIVFQDFEGKTTTVSLEKYEAFLQLIRGDRSQLTDNNSPFQRGQYLQILVYLRSGQEKGEKVFQVIEVSKDDYRVNLQEEMKGQWALFHHPGIGEEVLKFFSGKR